MTDKTYFKKLGQRIEARRKILGISQNELARKLDTKNNQVRRIEKGLTNPKISTLRKVAEELKMTLGELVEIK